MNPSSRAPVVTLRKDLARSVRQGHPWLFRDALADDATLAALKDGDVVAVVGKDRRPLCWGFWDARSPIAVRILGLRPATDRSRLPEAAAVIEQRLRSTLARRRDHLDSTRTNAFRWVHGEADQLPGVHIDLYDDVAIVRTDGDGARAFYSQLNDIVFAAARAEGLDLSAVIERGQEGPDTRVVRENGVLFQVALGKGGKGGLFLDQRDNRAAIGARARDKTVLNLFGYTGGFSLYAALGGARRTDTVDISKPAIEAARANFALNGLDVAAHGFHAQDAFDFLTEATRDRRTWDIVISDPPSFAPSQRALPAARQSYRRLHRMAAAVVADGGLFCPASCSSHFPRAEFLASVEAGAADAKLSFTLESLTGAGFDHPVLPAFPEGDYLKFAVGRLSPAKLG